MKECLLKKQVLFQTIAIFTKCSVNYCECYNIVSENIVSQRSLGSFFILMNIVLHKQLIDLLALSAQDFVPLR
jgi:hypothetical protein